MTNKQQITLRLCKDKPPVVGQGMIGDVVSHPLHAPGTTVATTAVLHIYEDGTVETKHSIYTIVY